MTTNMNTDLGKRDNGFSEHVDDSTSSTQLKSKQTEHFVWPRAVSNRTYGIDVELLYLTIAYAFRYFWVKQ